MEDLLFFVNLTLFNSYCLTILATLSLVTSFLALVYQFSCSCIATGQRVNSFKAFDTALFLILISVYLPVEFMLFFYVIHSNGTWWLVKVKEVGSNSKHAEFISNEVEGWQQNVLQIYGTLMIVHWGAGRWQRRHRRVSISSRNL